MILYRKAAPLRIRRFTAPEPPFWCATVVAPYGPRRASPLSIDYPALRAEGVERSEVTVCENVRDELERTRPLQPPVLIDATGNAEAIFRRGEEAFEFCDEQDLPALLLTSSGTHGVVRASGAPLGVVIPVIYPITTDLATLDALAADARKNGAAFFAAIPIELEATAKQAIASELQLAGDDDRYEMLFHSDVAPIHLATERHIAALAAAHGMSDFVIPPRWNERSNWNAAVLLTLLASRMIAMELDLDLAGMIARSARAVAELDKPLARVAEAASLSIVETLDDVSRDALNEWLAGSEPSFVQHVNEQWRLSRQLT